MLNVLMFMLEGLSIGVDGGIYCSLKTKANLAVIS